MSNDEKTKYIKYYVRERLEEYSEVNFKDEGILEKLSKLWNSFYDYEYDCIENSVRPYKPLKGAKEDAEKYLIPFFTELLEYARDGCHIIYSQLGDMFGEPAQSCYEYVAKNDMFKVKSENNNIIECSNLIEYLYFKRFEFHIVALRYHKDNRFVITLAKRILKEYLNDIFSNEKIYHYIATIELLNALSKLYKVFPSFVAEFVGNVETKNISTSISLLNQLNNFAHAED